MSLPFYESCNCGGLYIYNMKKYDHISKVTGICGQDYFNYLPSDLPRNVSFVSSDDAFLLVIVLYDYYVSHFAVDLTIEVTKCKGLYAQDILTWYRPNCPCCLDMEYTLSIGAAKCIQIHSTQPWEEYHQCADRFRDIQLMFRCENCNLLGPCNLTEKYTR